MTLIGGRADAGHGRSTWHIAALPALVLLGVVLPLVFVPQLEDFLYYLRPSDLLPAYGTAWLFLAIIAAPLWALLALALKGLGLVRRGGVLQGLLRTAVIAAAAIAAIGALLYCLLVWLQTFGVVRALSFRRQLLWAAVVLGVGLACTSRGRALVMRSVGPATWCLAFGALAAISIPFFGWQPGAGPAARATPAGAPGNPPARAADPPRPHIVLLTIDALSAEHMSLYGAARPTTPKLAAFAAAATTFDRTYANGNFTTPGIASILTGTRPWTHR
ncbi:MAG: sulfatase-like hydrolase/transferase, partial [Steroidobacteraceae bacterium]